MNSSRISTGSTMCGIILENGEDCNGKVNPDHNLNLCSDHIQEAFEIHGMTGKLSMVRVEGVKCDVCGCTLAYVGQSGFMCAKCAYKTPDFFDESVEDYDLKLQRDAAFIAKAPLRPSVVYYMQFGDRIKIGTTRNILKRMREVPNDRVLATEPGEFHLEAVRHNEFKSARIKGEWFRQSPELLAHVEALQKNW